MRITLEDIYNGHDFVFKYNRKVICPHCRGNGADSDDDIRACDHCGGTGTVTQKQKLGPGFVQQFQTTCPSCDGQGSFVTSTCHLCKGNKLMDSIDELRVYIEVGVPDGHVYTYDDSADEFLNVRSGPV
jgi:DnaJ-related protein SCJ1